MEIKIMDDQGRDYSDAEKHADVSPTVGDLQRFIDNGGYDNWLRECALCRAKEQVRRWEKLVEVGEMIESIDKTIQARGRK